MEALQLFESIDWTIFVFSCGIFQIVIAFLIFRFFHASFHISDHYFLVD